VEDGYSQTGWNSTIRLDGSRHVGQRHPEMLNGRIIANSHFQTYGSESVLNPMIDRWPFGPMRVRWTKPTSGIEYSKCLCL